MATRDRVESEWLTLAAAARLAGVGRMTLHRAAARGDLPYADTPMGRLFWTNDVAVWAATRDGGSTHGNKNR